MARIYLLTAAALVAGLLGGLFYMVVAGRSDDVFAACRTTQIAGGSAAIGGPFELVNHEGETVTDADVITEPSLIYFGYTFCPDVCPLDTARNARSVDILQEEGYAIQPVFISIDPARDTPEVLSEFVSYMHPDMIGLTGSEEQVRAASQAYRTYYARQESEDDEFYLVDHSTFSYLVLPDHGFVELFRRNVSAEQLAERVSCFLDAA
ncbi:SCO family protein [Rhodobacteraceae bacterium WD3A24]|nr:SCO family protein [Rhodobacteraceae bacterium WD3A24]